MPLSIEAVPVRVLIDETFELMRPVAVSRGVTMDPPELAATTGYVVADHQRFKQVLINLVSNAIKYNRRGGRVWMTVEPDQGSLRIAVHDTGRGIQAAALERLFTPFERLGADGSGIEGTGLGLALSRDLVVAMGGRMEVSSTAGEGSCFAVELPAAETSAVAEPVGAVDSELLSVRSYPGVRQLLYVEDTLANVRLVEGILTRRPSVRLLPAIQGRVGLDLARQHRPDLVLLDLHLPDMGGQDVLAELRADPATSDVPVVILSADATADRPRSLLAQGADAYLTKPISVHRLLEVLDEFLGGSPGTRRAGVKPHQP